MKLSRKITCFVIGILLVSIGSITFLSFNEMKTLLKEQFTKNMLDIGNSVGENYIVKEYLSGNKNISQDTLNNEVENTRKKVNFDFIVVMDMNGIRHSHPTKEKIGKKFSGGDEKEVLSSGKQYVSEAKGTLGISLRSFTPIYNNNKQVGAVCVGILSINFNEQTYAKMYKFIPFILLGLILGAAGAILLSYNIKQSILGLEPGEITLILKEKEAVVQSIKEGIIAVDTKGRITLFNKEAQNIIGLKDEDIGKYISDIIHETKVNDVLKNGEPLEAIEVKIKPDVSVLSKYNPLKNDKNQIIGLVVTFENLTEVRKMAEELTGIKKITWSLRAQNHEFMNKLHTISGLIQLEEYDEALKFVSSIAKSKKELSTIITEKIKDISVAALLLAKYSKAEEARVKFTIDENSMFKSLPKYITSEELVSVIGNLLENSLDVVSTDETGEIYLKIYEENKNLKIILKDNGPGINKDICAKIYEMGVTSKKGQRGLGMYIVKNIINSAKGTIEFKLDHGTSWFISIPMQGE